MFRPTDHSKRAAQLYLDLFQGLEPVDKVSSASAELKQDNEQKVSNSVKGEETLVEAIASFNFDDSVLAGLRKGYRSDAVSTAEKTLAAYASATETILQMAGWIQEMRSRLSRKEFGTFVKELLQWVGEETRKYLDIARAFEGFDLSRLVSLEPFTILKLRSKRYAPVVAKLKEQPVITPEGKTSSATGSLHEWLQLFGGGEGSPITPQIIHDANRYPQKGCPLPQRNNLGLVALMVGSVL